MSNRISSKESLVLPAGKWPHRWAWVLAVGVFPLIWIGGLVTTYEDGMSVPDWPTTFGSWFYPLQKWLWHFSSHFYFEHSHRTIAQIDGFLTLILMVSIWRAKCSKSVRWLATAILLALVSQGVLGGLRVVLDDRILARIHGCAAPLIFAMCAAMVILTSASWRSGAMDTLSWPCGNTVGRISNPSHNMPRASVGMAFRIALAICVGLYFEIVLGAQFRHPLPDTAPVLSPILVWAKVIIAALLLGGIGYLLISSPHPTSPGARSDEILNRRVKLLAVLYVLQLVLAGTTWVSNFDWPKWFTDYVATMNYTVVQTGKLQIWATTAHAAVGSLCFVAALGVALWSFKRMKDEG
jgi:heme a synthase